MSKTFRKKERNALLTVCRVCDFRKSKFYFVLSFIDTLLDDAQALISIYA